MPDLTLQIYDLQTSQLIDVSDIALTKAIRRRLNQPRQFVFEVPTNRSVLSGTFTDGFPKFETGDRKLIVWRDSQVIFHGRIFTIERTGDGLSNRATVTAIQPQIELGYESDDRAGRYVRQPDGNLIDPKFGDPISGGDLIYQALANSQQTGTESDPAPGEGPLPIDLTTGAFDYSVPPAVNLSVDENMDWPIQIGDFIQMLTETGCVDYDERPVDPIEGLDPYIMVAASAVNKQGIDRSGNVHFDYWTGSKNAKAAHYTEDFTIICNKLYDYLGPRLNQEHWQGNITGGFSGAFNQTVSRTRYGTFMAIREFDQVGNENSNRAMWKAAWQAEAYLRRGPRALAFLTPNPGAKALYQPFSDYDVGDVVAINLGGDIGVNLAAAQRIYGFDVEWSRQNTEQVSELIVSADQE